MELEKELVERAKAGDAEAFGQLYELYFKGVFRFCYLRLETLQDAEDATAEVFMRALASISKFKWKGVPFSSWLFRIAHNLAMDLLRSSRRRRTIPLEDELQIASHIDPTKDAQRRFDLEEVQHGMKDLTELQRRVIALRFGAGLSIFETARAMEKGENAVKALQHSALRALRRKMGDASPSSLQEREKTA